MILYHLIGMRTRTMGTPVVPTSRMAARIALALLLAVTLVYAEEADLVASEATIKRPPLQKAPLCRTLSQVLYDR